MVRRRSAVGPSGSGRSRRVRRRSRGRTRRRISRLASAISSTPIASKSICCSFSWSDTVSTASATGGSSSCRRCCFCGGAKASATRREAGGARSCFFSFCASSSAIATACSAAVGSRQNRAKAWSNTSWCSRRCTITLRSAVRTSARLPISTSDRACWPASVSAGPTGSPARRSRRAKCMTLVARVGLCCVIATRGTPDRPRMQGLPAHTAAPGLAQSPASRDTLSRYQGGPP